MVDDHGRGRPSSAVRLMQALEPYNLFFLEEPTQPDDIEGLARIRAAGPKMVVFQPILITEKSIFVFQYYQRILVRRW